MFFDNVRKLENNPTKVYITYLSGGRPEDEAKDWERIFASDTDNWFYKNTSAYRGEKYYIEVAALYLVWIIPLLMIFIAMAVGKRSLDLG